MGPCASSISLRAGRSPQRQASRRQVSQLLAPLLCSLDRDVLVGPGVSEGRDKVEPRLADAWSICVEEGELPDRRVNRLLVDELLYLVQDRRAPAVVQLGCLFLEQFVDVGVVAIGIGAALDDIG